MLLQASRNLISVDSDEQINSNAAAPLSSVLRFLGLSIVSRDCDAAAGGTALQASEPTSVEPIQNRQVPGNQAWTDYAEMKQAVRLGR